MTSALGGAIGVPLITDVVREVECIMIRLKRLKILQTSFMNNPKGLSQERR